jgi:hypothetical protein
VTPADSQLNVRVTQLDIRFDEYITLNNPASEVTVAPVLPFPLNVEAKSRRVTIQIPDSLLRPNTTYRISFGDAIRDLHEGNPFSAFTYTFSTGNYFDSLSLSGFVVNAATGHRDSGALVVLYETSESDSAVVRQKPMYVARTMAGGNYSFKGLPATDFRVYALKDDNNNLVFDGPPEQIGFLERSVNPADTPQLPVVLHLFLPIDTVTGSTTTPVIAGRRPGAEGAVTPADNFSYNVLVDTSDLRKRTQDITEPLQIVFTRPLASFNINRVSLIYDSAGTIIEVPVTRNEDTGRRQVVFLQTDWKENAVYTLRLLKGFARDTAGNEVMPARFSFRTKRDEDYSKLQVNLPGRFYGDQYIFVLQKANDTIYHRTVTDTVIRFTRLQPGNYNMRVIHDRNRNGKWDTGDLFGNIQPEEVFPFMDPMNLRAGWEHIIDFVKPANVTGPGSKSTTR